MGKLISITFACFLFIACASNQSIETNPEVGSKTKKKGEYPSLPSSILEAEHKGIDGKTIRLSDYQGKIVLVNLWATWCAPCRKEIPVLIELQKKYADKGFIVIGLDVDETETEARIKNFAQEMQINYLLGWISQKDQNEFLKISRFEGVPQSFLVSRDGELLGVFMGGGDQTILKLRDSLEKAFVD